MIATKFSTAACKSAEVNDIAAMIVAEFSTTASHTAEIYDATPATAGMETGGSSTTAS